MLIAMSFASLPILPYQVDIGDDNDDNDDNNRNNLRDKVAYAIEQANPVSIRLYYAHFMPLSNNSNLHQVKVIVLYNTMPSSMIPINAVQNAVMKVYATNGTLLRTTSFPAGLELSATGGKAQLATTLDDSTISNVTASVTITDSSKSLNYSNPLSVSLGLRQQILP
jgi:hypothetical protein